MKNQDAPPFGSSRYVPFRRVRSALAHIFCTVVAIVGCILRECVAGYILSTPPIVLRLEETLRPRFFAVIIPVGVGSRRPLGSQRSIGITSCVHGGNPPYLVSIVTDVFVFSRRPLPPTSWFVHARFHRKEALRQCALNPESPAEDRQRYAFYSRFPRRWSESRIPIARS